MKYEDYKEAAEYIKKNTGGSSIAVVLGSGLGNFTKRLTDAVKIPYTDIPHFPKSTAPSHEGALYCGMIGDTKIICMSGRFHYYEGYSLEEVTFYVRALYLAGVEKLIITNAAGGINKEFSAGDLMLITDHINFTGLSPLRGENDSRFGERFPDVSDMYSKDLINTALKAAAVRKINLKQGIYAYMTGPSYETPSEIRALSFMGADAVGMSTVPEAVCAAHCGIKVLAISCITNMAAGITGEKLTEQEVIDNAAASNKKFSSFLEEVLNELG